MRGIIRFIHRRSIRTRLAIVVTLLIFFIAIFIAVYFPDRQEKQALKAIAAKAKCIADMTGWSIAPALYFEDNIGIDQAFRLARQNQDLIYLVVTDRSNRVIKSFNPEIAEATEFLTTKANRVLWAKRIYQISTPVYLNHQLIGKLYLGISLWELINEGKRIRMTIALVSFIIFVVGMFLTIGFSSLVTIPLRQIVRTALAIANGDWSKRAKIPVQDEIGQLAKSFNLMLDRLEQAHQELTELNRSLEEKVAERTKELAQEVRERKQVEERFRQSQELYKTIFENTQDPIYITTVDGKFISANPALLELFGYTDEELPSLNARDFYFNPADRERFKAEVAKNGYVKNFEVKLRKKDGTALDCVLTSTLRYDRDGKILGYQGVIHDFTERKRIEEQMRNLNEILEKKVRERTQELKKAYEQLKTTQEQFYQAQKMESIGILAGGIAHDFNNLLATILGNISLAKMMINQDDKLFNILTRAENVCLRAKDLTQQLLTFSRGGAPVKKVVAIAKILKDSANLALKGAKATYEFNLPDSIWPVEADEGQLLQVFNNLLINANQAMPEGGTIKISVENIQLDGDNGLQLPEGTYVKITIEDQGIGISEENLPKIFDPFFTTKPRGTGLGLTTAYSIIKRHNGAIQVNSKLGVGTTFHIYLPATHKTILVKPTEQEKLPEPTTLRGKGKILVMDDEPDVQEMVKEILIYLGYEVITAPNGEETISNYKQAKEEGKPFCCVIIDLTIKGGMGGKETISELLKIDPEVKAIVASGYANDPIIAEFAKFGFKGAVAKPFKVAELAKVLNEVLSEPAQPIPSSTIQRF
ncbi:MAG: ATP-binding protein [candidate division WOR-3 bacterium]